MPEYIIVGVYLQTVKHAGFMSLPVFINVTYYVGGLLAYMQTGSRCNVVRRLYLCQRSQHSGLLFCPPRAICIA